MPSSGFSGWTKEMVDAWNARVAQGKANYRNRESGNKDAKPNPPSDQKPGPHTGNKKLHVRNCGQKKPAMEKAMRRKFRVTITLKYSDERTRDSDAAVSSIFDAIIASRRFLEEYSGTLSQVHQGG